MIRRIACLLLALPLAANGLDALRTRLRGAPAADPIKASVSFENWSSQGDAKKPVLSQGRVNAWVECGPQGLRLFWGRDLLRRARQEAQALNENPELPTPTRDAMRGLEALGLQDCFEPAPHLLQDLDRAQLLEERADTLDGVACRLLRLKLEPRLPERTRKYVKELDATAKVWVDAEGWPLAAETQFKVRGKALLVVSFSSDEKDEYRFARVGGRLVTVRHASENSSSGAGESARSRKVTVLSYS